MFCNYIHNYPGLRTAYIYFGSWRRVYGVIGTGSEPPTNWAAGVTAADLDGDRYPELVFANQGVESGSEEISATTGFESYVYRGSATGFDVGRRQLLPTRGAVDVAAGDFNRDGFQDLAFLNNSKTAQGIQVFWGSARGYDPARMQEMPIKEPSCIQADDLDRDVLCRPGGHRSRQGRDDRVRGTRSEP